MDNTIKSHLKWVTMYLDTRNHGLVCNRCGISRPTLRKWVNRYQEMGVEGLYNLSKKPHTSPATKVTENIESLILVLRNSRNIGARRIQSELLRLHDIKLSLGTIHKILVKNNVSPLKRYKRKKRFNRYAMKTPGAKVQMDTMKLAPNFYQYTAIDDCTRYRVLRVYSRRIAANTLDFIEKAVEEMCFPVQRIQTDRGREFLAYKVQDLLLDWGIKLRPIRPASPHLNGKVERSQKTDIEEFYSTIDLTKHSIESLDLPLAEWQHYYNWERPYSSLNGKTPVEKYIELMYETPLQEEVSIKFNTDIEYRRNSNLLKKHTSQK